MGKHATPHGTASRYNSHGCRCVACRRAWADYIAARRRQHGVPSRGRMLAARRLRLERHAGESAAAFRQRRAAALARLREDAYYADKADRTVTVRPTALGLRLLEAVQERTGRSADDVVEQLLRSCSAHVDFDEPEPLALTG